MPHAGLDCGSALSLVAINPRASHSVWGPDALEPLTSGTSVSWESGRHFALLVSAGVDLEAGQRGEKTLK